MATLNEKTLENMTKKEYSTYYDLIEYRDTNGDVHHLPVPLLEGNFSHQELVEKACYMDIRNESFFWNNDNPSFYKDYSSYSNDELEEEYSSLTQREKLNYVRLLINNDNLNYVYVVDYSNLLI